MMQLSLKVNRQTKHIVMMSKKNSTNIVKFKAVRPGVTVLEWGPIDHITNMRYLADKLRMW